MPPSPKSKKLQELLDKLPLFHSDPTSADVHPILSQLLSSKSAIAVARTAKFIAKANLKQFCSELEATFEQFLLKPADTDPACLAKTAIADALYRMEHHGERLFLIGIHHIQMEPVWGGQVDTAPDLRVKCALGLVRMHYADLMLELADLLADPEPEARIGAARAIAYSENPQGVPLLRLKVKIGDSDPQVMSECFVALLKLAPTQSLSLIASFLDQTAELAEMAALALGESRLEAAFAILSQWWQQVRQPELRRTGLLAIAMLRQDIAFDFLLALVTDSHSSEADAAIAALRIYEDDRILWKRVCEAAHPDYP